MKSLRRRAGDLVESVPLRAQALRLLFLSLAAGGAFALTALLGTSLAGAPTTERAPSWSPDGEWLVFDVERDGQSDLYISRPDGSGRRAITETRHADERAPVFAPDGRRVAFESNRDQDVEIYVMALPSGHTVRLTHSPGGDLAPAWSPDGTALAFISQRDGRAAYDLYAMAADGTGARRLTSAEANAAPRFSPSGTQLVAEVNQQVRLFDVASLASRTLTLAPDDGREPAWHPSGQQVAFTTRRRGRAEIFTMTREGQEARPLVSMAGSQVSAPCWSPDGTKLAFVRTVGQGPQVDQLLGERAIYVMDVASGRVRRVSP